MVNDKSTSLPLFLTPYIEAGKLAKGREASAVLDLPWNAPKLESYSGFLTVNKQFNSNLFFWFFPPMSGKTKDVPVILWLHGGPGISTIKTILAYNGPYYIVEEGKVELNEHTWNREFALLYIDQPVGTGFSFTEDERGYAKTQEDMASDFYTALGQFFILFEDYRGNPFYMGALCYGTKFIISTGWLIYSKNEEAKQLGINFKGLALSSAFVNPRNQMNYGDFLYQLGMIDEIQQKVFLAEQQKCTQLIDKENYLEAKTVFEGILYNFEQSETDSTLFAKTTGSRNTCNVMLDVRPKFPHLKTFLELEETTRALNLENVKFDFGIEQRKHMAADFMQSSVPKLEQLLDAGYRAMFYSGNLDIFSAVPLVENMIQNLKWKGEEKYKNAERKIYKVAPDDKVSAGYVKQVDNLTVVSVRNAGHMISYDQPRVVKDLITKFVSGVGF